MSPRRGQNPDDVAREQCRSGVIQMVEDGARLAIALDPAFPHDMDALRHAVTATLRPAGGVQDGWPPVSGLALRLATAGGWHDIPADTVEELLRQAAGWIGLARPPLWSTARFTIANGHAAAVVPGKDIALPDWIAALAGRPVENADELLALAAGHAPAVEALLAGPPAVAAAIGAGREPPPPCRHLGHRRVDGHLPALTVPAVQDWLHESLATRHAIVARPAAPGTDRSQWIVVFPTLRKKCPTLNVEDAISPEPIVGAFVLICSVD